MFALSPSQIFEGVVRFADTNEPAPHARLTIWASQQEFGGSMISVPGKADAQGRYRINPYPGVRFGITAYPPDGVPYLIRKISDITHKDGALVKQVDVSLPRGVLVRGRVVESGTNTPVAGVAMAFSEFGRRAEENGSAGTDHGCAGPVFLAGAPVRGGLVGPHPSLTDLDEGDLKMSIDFRRVYATVLDHWLNVPSGDILAEMFEPLPLYKS